MSRAQMALLTVAAFLALCIADPSTAVVAVVATGLVIVLRGELLPLR